VNERFIFDSLPENIKPSSLDIRVNLDTLIEVSTVFMPSVKEMTIAETLATEKIGAKKVTKTADGYFIERDKVYIAEVIERIILPPNVSGRANPKSSTGRNDVHVRLLADYSACYDGLPFGWKGKLYVLIKSNSFNILFPNSIVSLNQIRFFKRNNGLVHSEELENLTYQNIIRNDHKNMDLYFSDLIHNNSKIKLSIDLRDHGDSPGYIAKQNVISPLIWRTESNTGSDFFELLQKANGDEAMIFQKNRFYILSSRESVWIPKEFACEMASSDDAFGEIRAHYAGFIDNGWGEQFHRPLTLEVRLAEDMLIYHGQPIVYLTFHHMFDIPDKGYDDGIGSNYSGQKTARLGKFFK
jgi:dCTP deaminase